MTDAARRFDCAIGLKAVADVVHGGACIRLCGRQGVIISVAGLRSLRPACGRSRRNRGAENGHDCKGQRRWPEETAFVHFIPLHQWKPAASVLNVSLSNNHAAQ
ncbi:hypothetical protein [Methylocystis sp. SC2]|uniref:hypothetical protein n=1 Tax=Methylocystis sp. (strain SC2) TaxID=187303 RepID=UPI0011D1FA86|nr:hypothetical protein [Methylocystis sp. SC2]